MGRARGTALALLAFLAVGAAGCNASELDTAIKEAAGVIHVTVDGMKPAAEWATSKGVAEDALATALRAHYAEAAPWDTLAVTIEAKSGTLDLLTDEQVGRFVAGSACDALGDAVAGQSPNFKTIAAQNALLASLPESVAGKVELVGLVRETYLRSQEGDATKATNAARMTYECGKVGRQPEQ